PLQTQSQPRSRSTTHERSLAQHAAGNRVQDHGRVEMADQCRGADIDGAGDEAAAEYGSTDLVHAWQSSMRGVAQTGAATRRGRMLCTLRHPRKPVPVVTGFRGSHKVDTQCVDSSSSSQPLPGSTGIASPGWNVAAGWKFCTAVATRRACFGSKPSAFQSIASFTCTVPGAHEASATRVLSPLRT